MEAWILGLGRVGGQGSATPEASGASRGGGGTDHAAGFSALATSRKSALRARWTSWAACRSVAACATASSCSKGDARLQEAIGSGQRSELLVRGHDQFLGVLPAAAPVGVLDLDGEEAGPVMVEEGGEEVAQEVVGRWGQMLRDVAVPQPPADDVAVLGLHQRVVVRAPGPGFRELLDVQLVQHRRDPVVDVLRPVVGMEGQDAEGERADERFEHGNHVVVGDPGNGRKLLELRHFVDHVDHVGPLLSVAVTAVDGVDAHEARPTLRPGSAPLPDRRRRRPGRPKRGPRVPVRPAPPQVVDVAVRNLRQALETLVAEDMVHAPEGPLRRRPRELAERFVHLGQQ